MPSRVAGPAPVVLSPRSGVIERISLVIALFGVRQPEPPLWYRAAAAARRGVNARWVVRRILHPGPCPGLKPPG